MNSNAEMMADERVWWSKQWQTNVNLLCIQGHISGVLMCLSIITTVTFRLRQS